jgi:hypothetical protein
MIDAPVVKRAQHLIDIALQNHQIEADWRDQRRSEEAQA